MFGIGKEGAGASVKFSHRLLKKSRRDGGMRITTPANTTSKA